MESNLDAIDAIPTRIQPITKSMTVPLIILTLGFNMYLRIKHFYVTNHLLTRDCLRLDREYHAKKGHNQDFSFVKTKYLQPALGATDAYPEVPQL